MRRLTFVIAISIYLIALLFDVITTYYGLLVPFIAWEENRLVRELLIRFDREMALILSFFIFSVSYAALLTLFYLGELYVTFILISVTISFGHFIAAISNLSIYLNKLWLWYSLRVLVANSEYIFLTVSVSAMLVEYCYKRKAKCKAVT